MIVRRVFSLPLLFLLTLLLMHTGCGGQSAPDPAGGGTESVSNGTPVDEGEPVDGDWVVNSLPAEPAHLNRLLDTADAYIARITTNVIFESLLDMDKDSFELIPMIAKSWEVSDDHLTYTFHMRDDVTFSDGKPVTAHDVKFTFETVLDPANETADIRNYYQDVTDIEVLDDYTIRFTCAKPYFRHLEMIGGMLIFPKHIYEGENFNTTEYNRKPIGSGPYVFESWQTNQQLVLARNPNFWDPERKVYPAKLVYKIITDTNATFQVLQRQELDLSGLMPEQWVNQASTPEFEARFNKLKYWGSTGYASGFGYIGWNMRKPQFSDKRVRRALTMLLDRELILEQIFYGLGAVVTGPLDHNGPEYNHEIEPWPFDPEQAKALLDEAGWVDSNSDGVRDKDGVKFSFEFMYPPGISEMDQMATFYQEELKRAGIDMRIRTMEWATFIENITKREFDAITLRWAVPPNSDPYQLWHSSQAEKGSNYPGFKNEEVDRLLDEIRLEFDREKRYPLYHRFHEILHEEQPYTFLWSRYSLVAVDKRFRGVKVYGLGLETTEWWAPLDEQRYP